MTQYQYDYEVKLQNLDLDGKIMFFNFVEINLFISKMENN